MRPLVIFAVGAIFLVGVFFFVTNVRLVVLLFSVIFFLLLVWGFTVQPPSDGFRAILPAQSADAVNALNEEADSAGPSAPVVFRVEMRSLPILFVATIFVLILVLWIARDLVQGRPLSVGIEDSRYPIFYLGSYAQVAALVVSGIWCRERERLMLRAPQAILARVYPLGQAYCYEFFDPTGERRGGMLSRRAQEMGTSGHLLVLLDPMNYDYSKPASSFMFHKFLLVGANLHKRGGAKSAF